MTPRVVLIGLPGAGKSTTGRRLAKILAVPFADSDDLVVAAEGRTVPVIFAESGEEAFRAAESRAVLAALQDFDGVLSLGGGALNHPDTRAAVTASTVAVVVLRARLETLLARVGDGATRPLLAGSPQERLAALARERGQRYTAVADFGVDTDGKSPGQVAATIAARLHEREVRAHG
ncbi:MAG TPA: shikimate kinase [Jatrophihabitans sp.]|nr:shikimate kinase [Jatrophihabitans sp.]